MRRYVWLSLLIFLFPLSLVADRFCWFAPMDAMYHGILALHRVLPQLVLGAALLSMAAVVVQIGLVRNRLALLSALSSEPPPQLNDAFRYEAQRAAVRAPEIVYLEAATSICFTASGIRRAKIFVSRGFIDDLDSLEFSLVARHEMVHVRNRDAAWNLFWHILFSALLLPGFTSLERTLRLRREIRANVEVVGSGDSLVYERLLTRRARDRHVLCNDGRPERRPSGFMNVAAPAAVVVFFIALAISHADFMHDLPYLRSHHC